MFCAVWNRGGAFFLEDVVRGKIGAFYLDGEIEVEWKQNKKPWKEKQQNDSRQKLWKGRKGYISRLQLIKVMLWKHMKMWKGK